jgi:hypothetical protein
MHTVYQIIPYKVKVTLNFKKNQKIIYSASHLSRRESDTDF